MLLCEIEYLCSELEAVMVMDNDPYLMIRQTYDYCNSCENKPMAAAYNCGSLC